VTKERDFQEWEEQYKSGKRVMQSGDDYFQWIGNVISSILPGSILGHDIAVSWIESDGALEWLVTGNLDRAVSSIYNSYRLHMSKPPGHSWIQAILQAAWPELREQAHYSEVRVALELLFKQVGIAKKKLEDGLLYIRDTYEGGAPPV
jgi:hypothetical protein